ncbi:aldo/keto reductase [Lactobacillus amylovorus]|uniref:aldo/keto reductase n=1 Tax=Lactobacillus amylovorus TaxID=1604 RepID=UPI003F89B5AC
MSLLDEAVVLNDGSLMPKVGVTVTSDEDVAKAMKAGYRLLNCTADEKIDFKNLSPQTYVEIQVSEKVNTREEMRNNLKEIRNNLVAKHADLAMLRLSDDAERNNQLWQELEQVKIQGWLKNIGVTNANGDTLAAILKSPKIKPSVINLDYEDGSLIKLARENKMQVELSIAGDIDALAEIAGHYGTSTMELVLRYFAQKRIVPIVQADDIVENPQTDFTIAPEDMGTIGQLFAGK